MISKENLRFAFHHFDSDHDGFISAENLVEAFHREGKMMSEEDINKMLDEAGLARDAKLNFDDFSKLMS